jgi:hypothetical protein
VIAAYGSPEGIKSVGEGRDGRGGISIINYELV